MQSTLWTTIHENDRPKHIQFKSFTAGNYEAIKQRERKKEGEYKVSSKDGERGGGCVKGLQKGGAHVARSGSMSSKVDNNHWVRGLRTPRVCSDDSGIQRSLTEALSPQRSSQYERAIGEAVCSTIPLASSTASSVSEHSMTTCPAECAADSSENPSSNANLLRRMEIWAGQTTDVIHFRHLV